MIYEIRDKTTIEVLFAGWEESLIYSCIQNHMGKAYVTDKVHPDAAIIIVDVFCFLAGNVNDELIKACYQNREFMILTPQNEEWAKRIETLCGKKAHKCVRYAIKREPEVFQKDTLQSYVEQLPNGYHLQRIDESLYDEVMKEEWSRDLCSLFHDAQEYMQHGLGIVALKDDKIVSGASSYAYFDSGIEIEIDTKLEERRKGLALACGAMLLLECLKKGMYPSWDAQNKHSVALAEKLGYHFDHEYSVYEVYED